MELTSKEINIIIEALEAWENKDTGLGFAMDLMSLIVLPKETRESPEFQKTEEERTAKQELEKRERKETSLLLKAKLVGMKQEQLSKEASEILKS